MGESAKILQSDYNYNDYTICNRIFYTFYVNLYKNIHEIPYKMSYNIY